MTKAELDIKRAIEIIKAADVIAQYVPDFNCEIHSNDFDFQTDHLVPVPYSKLVPLYKAFGIYHEDKPINQGLPCTSMQVIITSEHKSKDCTCNTGDPMPCPEHATETEWQAFDAEVDAGIHQ